LLLSIYDLIIYFRYFVLNFYVDKSQFIFVVLELLYANIQLRQKKKQSPWLYSASELYRQNDRHFSAKLMPIFAVTGCRVVSASDPHGRILGFLDLVNIQLQKFIPEML
jgi:hypothetical protein